jgi:hypothetical protein
MRRNTSYRLTEMKRGKTINRPPTSGGLKGACKVVCVFEAEMTMVDGQVIEGWFWCEGPSWKPGEPFTGPFATERRAAGHADTDASMVQ